MRAFILILGLVTLLSVAGIFDISLGWAGSAEEDAQAVYDDTAAFDGGDGSTINTSPSAEN